MLKICCAIIVLNEIDYIKATLQSMYAVSDLVVVVENANRFSWDRATPAGLSTDGTTQAIENFPDPRNKINHIKLGRVQWENEAREAYLNIIPNDFMVIVCDADESWLAQDIYRARDFLMDNPKYEGVLAEHVMFWGNF